MPEQSFFSQMLKRIPAKMLDKYYPRGGATAAAAKNEWCDDYWSAEQGQRAEFTT